MTKRIQMREFKIKLSKPSDLKNQAINIAQLTYPTFSYHLALLGASYLMSQNLKKILTSGSPTNVTQPFLFNV